MNSTKRAIQTTFIDLYRKKSYDQMNVKELCVQTPVARTTFYEYYDNLGTLKAEIEDELIGGILKIAKATAGGSFVEMNLNVFFAQTLDYIKSHWEENYAFLVAQPNLAYIRRLAFENLDRCVYVISDDTLNYLNGKKKCIDEMTVKTRDFYKDR